jgi:hypothetical protein
MQIPIPKVYWDTLQAALQAQVKKLAKEIATTLNQSEVPLLKALAAEKVGAYLFEEEGSELVDLQAMRCQQLAPSQENPAVLQTCNEPILLGKNNCCPYHTASRKAAKIPTRKLRILKDKATGRKFWIDEDNTLLTSELEPCGYYNNSCRLCILTSDIPDIP